MKKTLYAALAAGALLTACTPQKQEAPSVKLTVANALAVDRNNEIVQLDYLALRDSLGLTTPTDQIIILDASGNQVVYQIAANQRDIIFPATVAANGTATYTVKAGKPEEFEASVFGEYYPDRVDDIAWENEFSAYRLYGPALQASGERAFGYDVWCKSVTTPVVDLRYRTELNNKAKVDSLRAAGNKATADSLYAATCYHFDHGNGLDCYKVGPTLGGGTAALYVDGKIVYPYCYKTFNILENGPLRFTVSLEYNPTVINGDTVVEHRVISCEKGSNLNKCTIAYAGLNNPTEVVTGIVLHPENLDSLATNNDKKYIAYADLTDNVKNNNGVIYVGAVCPSLKDAKTELFSKKESEKERGNASGHVLAVSDYTPNTFYTYYFGSGWSKGNMANFAAWEQYLEEYSSKLAAPLQVSVSK